MKKPELRFIFGWATSVGQRIEIQECIHIEACGHGTVEKCFVPGIITRNWRLNIARRY